MKPCSPSPSPHNNLTLNGLVHIEACQEQHLAQSNKELNDIISDNAECKDLLEKNPKLFAHIHLDSMAKNSGYEGLNDSVALKYFIALLASSPIKETLTEHLPPDFLEKLAALLTQSLSLQTKISSCTKSQAQLLANEIGTQVYSLKAGESLLIPGGYSATVSHLIYYEFIRQEDNKFTFCLYNTQDIQEGNSTIYGEHKHKISPYKVFKNITDEALFFTDSNASDPCFSIFYHLLWINKRFEWDKESASLSDIFAVLSPLAAFETKDSKPIYMTPQRSGTCVWRTLKGFVYSYCCRQASIEPDFLEKAQPVYKALITWAKIYSLSWLQKKHDKQADQTFQLTHAARMFSDRLEKIFAQEEQSPGVSLIPERILTKAAALVHACHNEKIHPHKTYQGTYSKNTKLKILALNCLNQAKPLAPITIRPRNMPSLPLFDNKVGILLQLEALANSIQQIDLTTLNKQEEHIFIDRIEELVMHIPLPQIDSLEQADWFSKKNPQDLFDDLSLLYTTYFGLVSKYKMHRLASPLITMQKLHILSFNQAQKFELSLKDFNPDLLANEFIALANNDAYFRIDDSSLLEQFNALCAYMSALPKNRECFSFVSSLDKTKYDSTADYRILFPTIEELEKRNEIQEELSEFFKVKDEDAPPLYQSNIKLGLMLYLLDHRGGLKYIPRLYKIKSMACISKYCLGNTLKEELQHAPLHVTKTDSFVFITNLIPIESRSQTSLFIVRLGDQYISFKNKKHVRHELFHGTNPLANQVLSIKQPHENNALVQAYNSDLLLEHIALSGYQAEPDSMIDSLIYFLEQNPEFLYQEENRIIFDTLLFRLSYNTNTASFVLPIEQAAQDPNSYKQKGRFNLLKTIILKAMAPISTTNCTNIENLRTALYYICLGHKIQLSIQDAQKSLGPSVSDEQKIFTFFEDDFDLRTMLSLTQEVGLYNKAQSAIHMHILSHYMQKNELQPQDFANIYFSWYKLQEDLILTDKQLSSSEHQCYMDKFHLSKIENWVRSLEYHPLLDKSLPSIISRLCLEYGLTDRAIDIKIQNIKEQSMTFLAQINGQSLYFNLLYATIYTAARQLTSSSLNSTVKEYFEKLFGDIGSFKLEKNFNQISFLDPVYGRIQILSNQVEQPHFTIQREGQDQWHTFVDLQKDIDSTKFNIPQHLVTDYTHWFSTNRNRLYFFDPLKACYVGCYNLKNHSFEWDTKPDLTIATNKALFDKYRFFDEPVFWENKQGLITIIEFPRLNIEFNYDQSTDSCFLKDNPLFKLIPPPPQSHFTHTSGVLYFEHQESNEVLLLCSLHQKVHTYNKKFYYKIESEITPFNKDKKNRGTIEVFTFTLQKTSENEEVFSSDPECNLYLAHLFSTNANYIQALKYLSKVGSIENTKLFVEVFTIFLDFIAENDLTPNGAALSLHAYDMFRYIDQINDKYISSHIETLTDRYLTNKRNICQALKLSPKQEARLEPFKSKPVPPDLTNPVGRLELDCQKYLPPQLVSLEFLKNLEFLYNQDNCKHKQFLFLYDHTMGLICSNPFSKKPVEVYNHTILFWLFFAYPQKIKASLITSINRLIQADTDPSKRDVGILTGEFNELINKILGYNSQLLHHFQDMMRKQFEKNSAIPSPIASSLPTAASPYKESLTLGAIPADRPHDSAPFSIPDISFTSTQEVQPECFLTILESLEKEKTVQQDFIRSVIRRRPIDEKWLTLHQTKIYAAGIQDPCLETILLYSSQDDCIEKIQSLNPTLNEVEIRGIIDACHNYMKADLSCKHLKRLHTLQEDCSKALWLQSHPLVEKFHQLKQQDPLHAESDPSLIYFQFMCGFHIRPEQYEIIQDIQARLNEGDSCCFQLMMGGGKTSVIMSLLLAKVAQQEDKISVFLCHHSQYNSAIGNLTKFQKERFDHKVYCIDCTRKELSLEKLNEIQRIFKKGKKGQNGQTKPICIIMKTHMLQTLELEYVSLLLHKESLKDHAGKAEPEITLHEEKIAKLKSILTMAQENVVAFLDEVDLNLNILDSVYFPQGEKKSLASHQILLAEKIFQFIINNDDLEAIIKLTQNRQSELSTEEYKATCLEPLAKLLKDSWCQLDDIPAEQKNNLELYLQQKLDDAGHTKLQVFLQSLLDTDKIQNKELVEQISLAKGLLNEILPATFTKSCSRGYGRFDKTTGKVCPFRGARIPASTQFGNAFESMCFHFQTAIYSRCSVEQMKIIANEYASLANNYSLMQGLEAYETSEAQEFKDITGIDLLHISEKNNLELATNAVNQDPSKRLRLESILVHKYATYYEEFTSSSSHDLIARVKQTVSCSGIPWNIDSYPLKLQENCILDTTTEQKIQTTMLEAENKGAAATYFISTPTISQMFALYETEPQKFAQFQGIIDVAGLFKEHDNLEVANQIIQELELRRDTRFKCVLFFHTRHNKFALLTKSENKLFLLNNTTQSEIQRYGILSNEIFVYYDELRSTGTDILQPPQARNLLTVDLHKVLSRSILQGALRLRALFDEQNVDMVLLESAKTILQDPQQSALLQTIFDISSQNQQNEIFKHTNYAFKEQIDTIFKDQILRSMPSENNSAFLTRAKPFLVKNSTADPCKAFGANQSRTETIAYLQLLIKQKRDLYIAEFQGILAKSKFDPGLKKIDDALSEILKKAQMKLGKQLESHVLHSDAGPISMEVVAQIEQEVELQVETSVEQETQNEYEICQATGRPVIEKPFTTNEIQQLLSISSNVEIPYALPIQECFKPESDYKKPYFQCFTGCNLSISRNLRSITCATASVFNKLYTAKNPTFALVKQLENEEFEMLMLSESDYKSLMQHFWQGNQLPQNTWIINPAGSLIQGDHASFIQANETCLFHEQLWYLNFYLGDVLFLISDTMKEFTEQKIYRSPIKELFINFLKLKNMECSKNLLLLSHQYLFSDSSIGFQTRARVGYETGLTIQLENKDPNTMSRYELQFLSPLRVDELKEDKLSLLKQRDQIKKITPSKINYITESAVQHTTKKQIAQLTNQALITQLRQPQLEHIQIEQIPFLTQDQRHMLRKIEHIHAVCNELKTNEQWSALILKDQLNQDEILFFKENKDLLEKQFDNLDACSDRQTIDLLAPHLGPLVSQLTNKTWTQVFTTANEIHLIDNKLKTGGQWITLIQENRFDGKQTEFLLQNMSVLQNHIQSLETCTDQQTINLLAPHLGALVHQLTNQKWTQGLATPNEIHFIKDELKTDAQWEILIQGNCLNAQEVNYLGRNKDLLKRHIQSLERFADQLTINRISPYLLDLVQQLTTRKWTQGFEWPSEIHFVKNRLKTVEQWEILIARYCLTDHETIFLQKNIALLQSLLQTLEAYADLQTIGLLSPYLGHLVQQLTTQKWTQVFTEASEIHLIKNELKTTGQWKILIQADCLNPQEVNYLGRNKDLLGSLLQTLETHVGQQTIGLLSPYLGHLVQQLTKQEWTQRLATPNEIHFIKNEVKTTKQWEILIQQNCLNPQEVDYLGRNKDLLQSRLQTLEAHADQQAIDLLSPRLGLLVQQLTTQKWTQGFATPNEIHFIKNELKTSEQWKILIEDKSLNSDEIEFLQKNDANIEDLSPTLIPEVPNSLVQNLPYSKYMFIDPQTQFNALSLDKKIIYSISCITSALSQIIIKIFLHILNFVTLFQISQIQQTLSLKSEQIQKGKNLFKTLI